MSRAVITLASPADRARARDWINRAPGFTRVEFKGPQRSLEQNSLMWAMLTDIATQKRHGGRRYSTDQWKVLFLHACGREVQFLLALDNSTFVPYGQSSSDLSTAEMRDLLEFMYAWGAENDVVWTEPRIDAERREQIEQQKAITYQPESAAT